MDYKNLNKLIHRFNNNRWVRNVTQSINLNVIFEFLNNEYFTSGMHNVIYQSNASHKRWYKGEHVYDWFQSVITDIHNGFKPLKVLANNSKIPGYKK
ncbi:MAG: hypothetical protein LBF00_03925 [Mycoplasmataceae bacterium]|jgi:hypothetical protein|nr:hypothetical protein [Mycoplasmataceae bacterium]